MKIRESKLVHEMRPGAGNPRNSEGSFLTLRDGTIAFAYSCYRGESSNDHAACDVCMIASHDGGESFSTQPRTLVRAADHGESNVMSVSLLRLGNGDAGLLYLLKRRGGRVSDVILRRSADEFATLDAGVSLLAHAMPAYYVINNDRLIRTSAGRLILPVAWHPSTVEESLVNTFDARAASCFYLSDDDGVTWRQSRSILHESGAYARSGLQEPGVVELPGGALYAYFRTDMGCHYESVSVDGGEHWFAPQPSRFSAPCSPLQIRCNPYSGKYYAVWNPIPEYVGRKTGAKVWTGGRNPLVIAESTDGYNFGDPVVIEDDDTRGFCYPAIHFVSADTLLLAYCSGGEEDGMCLCRTTIRKIQVEGA